MQNNQIIILHDLNGKPYYEAVEYYAKKNGIQILYYESSVFKLFIRDIVKHQFGINTIKRTIKNIIFRLKVPFIKNKIIILGMAPYDFRIIWYKKLLKNNNFIYSTSHPLWGDESKNPRKYGLFTFIFKNSWKSFLKDKKLKISTVTKSAYTTLKDNYEINGKMSQIYHTVDTSKFYKSATEEDNKFHILFAGKLLYEKGLDTVVELIETIDNETYHFHIVGDGEYKDKISHVFKYKNVTYHGWISDKSVLANIYQQCHIFLNPSIKNSKWQELFGIVNIEAMASGLVVIASNHIGPSEIIDNGVNGFLVEEKESSEIINIIKNLYEDRDLLQAVSQQAIKSSKKYSIDTIAKEWEKVINEK